MGGNVCCSDPGPGGLASPTQAWERWEGCAQGHPGLGPRRGHLAPDPFAVWPWSSHFTCWVSTTLSGVGAGGSKGPGQGPAHAHPQHPSLHPCKEKVRPVKRVQGWSSPCPRPVAGFPLGSPGRAPPPGSLILHRASAFKLVGVVERGRSLVGCGSPKPPALGGSMGSWPEHRQGALQGLASPGPPSPRPPSAPPFWGPGPEEKWHCHVPLPGELGGWGVGPAKVELLFQARGYRGRQGQVSLGNLALSTQSLPSTLVRGPSRCPSTTSCQEHPCSFRWLEFRPL